jgi:hypothetical protein
MLQTRSRKPSLGKLVDLPREVFVEILLPLEWKDFLRAYMMKVIAWGDREDALIPYKIGGRKVNKGDYARILG